MIKMSKNSGGGVQMLSYKPPPKCTDAGRWEDMIYNMLPQAGGDLPKGVIVMWSGAVDTIPGDWALCDGTNGTPDLRGRFVLGAGDGHSVGSTGGEDAHTLIESEMANHTHSTDSQGDHVHSGYTSTEDINHSHKYERGGVTWAGGGVQVSVLANTTGYSYTEDASVSHSHQIILNSAGNHTHSISYAGESHPHNNMPPYYALAYIMKL